MFVSRTQTTISTCYMCNFSLLTCFFLDLGLDEVGALVFDFGSHSIRAGYAGEDTPKVRERLYSLPCVACSALHELLSC